MGPSPSDIQLEDKGLGEVGSWQAGVWPCEPSDLASTHLECHRRHSSGWKYGLIQRRLTERVEKRNKTSILSKRKNFEVSLLQQCCEAYNASTQWCSIGGM